MEIKTKILNTPSLEKRLSKKHGGINMLLLLLFLSVLINISIPRSTNKNIRFFNRKIIRHGMEKSIIKKWQALLSKGLRA